MGKVILASGSRARAALLSGAGVQFDIEPAAVDEAEVKLSLLAEGAKPASIAEYLAELKACRVARRNPSILCIGSDQTMECDGVMMDKPPSIVVARTRLQQLRGKKHRLFAQVVISLDGQPIWRHAAKADLWMRDFSDQFLDEYLARCGPEILETVGGYRVEGIGIQLFSHINGDHSTILGLPLLPVLDYLRTQGVLTQ